MMLNDSRSIFASVNEDKNNKDCSAIIQARFKFPCRQRSRIPKIFKIQRFAGCLLTSQKEKQGERLVVLLSIETYVRLNNKPHQFKIEFLAELRLNTETHQFIDWRLGDKILI